MPSLFYVIERSVRPGLVPKVFPPTGVVTRRFLVTVTRVKNVLPGSGDPLVLRQKALSAAKVPKANVAPF
jgi:hypothetical protein